MAYLGKTYRRQELPDEQQFDPIPPGWYSASITSADVKDSSTGGRYLNIRFDITGPEFAGRVVFGMINIVNKSPKAEEIAHAQLGSLMKAVGIEHMEDSDELVGRTCRVKVAIDHSPGFDPKNVVKSYKADGTPAAAHKTPASVTVPVSGEKTKSAPPWVKS